MDKSSISLIISALALLVSASVAFFQIFRSVSQSQLDRVRTRSSLLTQIVELKIGYEKYSDDLIGILKVTKRYTLKEHTLRLERMLSNVEGFGSSTKQYYEWLITSQGVSHKSMEEVRHHIEALQARVKADREELEKIRDAVSKAEEEMRPRSMW